MSDKELLEWAAKAAGYEPESYHTKSNSLAVYNPGSGTSGNSFAPLTDDGDALRLAVKLDIGTDSNLSSTWAFSCTRDICSTEQKGTDPCAASRRAIVRTAAEIGKATS